jgi:hypothetical protein
MAPKRRYEGLMEEWPDRAQLYVKELPGFFAAAPTRDELIEISLPALDLHLSWLAGHGYEGAIADEGGLVIDEDLKSQGDAGPRFEADLAEPDEEAIEQALGLGRVALSDVIDLVDAMEESGGPSEELGRIVRHLAVQDLWFATRLDHAPPSLKPIADPVDAMVAAAGIFEERIDELAGKAPGIVTRDGEEWTLGKLLRRRTAHIREHALELAALNSQD